MKKIYHLGTCSTNSRILKDLNLTGVDLQDIKKEPISTNQIEEMAKIAGSYEGSFILFFFDISIIVLIRRLPSRWQ